MPTSAETTLFAADPAGWLVDTDQIRSSTLILLVIASLTMLVGALYWLGVGLVMRDAAEIARDFEP